MKEMLRSGAGMRQERLGLRKREEAGEEAVAAPEARTRQRRRRCGFSDKMADGDYLAEPAAPPTCSPAPGILGLVVSQRRQALGKPGAGGLPEPQFPAGSSRPSADPLDQDGPGGGRGILPARSQAPLAVQGWHREVSAGGYSPSVTLEAGVMLIKLGGWSTSP